MQKLNLLLGADPEMFLSRDGKFHSAFGLVKGDKLQPVPVHFGAVQVDGMALEFNIDPAASEEEFVHNINAVVAQMKDMVPSFNVMAVPVADFGEEYIRSQPRQARELGCNPDYNAYTGEENRPPNAELPFRTGAGHVHIGWTQNENVFAPEHYEMCKIIVKQLDVFLGIPSLLFDNNTQRREMYGKAGAFRPKTYGVEYRVLSNVWVSDSKLQSWVYRATHAAIRALEEGQCLFEKIGEDRLNNIINNSLIEEAKDIIREYGLILPEV